MNRELSRGMPPDLHATFALGREVGRGGMGVVYEAVHRTTGRRHAVKMVTSCAPDAAERMFREARAASMLRSQHATRIDAFGVSHDGTPYIVMELLEGVDLATFLAQSRGGLPVDVAVDIVRQACLVVGEAHDYGIVHRDLKPGNIFLTHLLDGSRHVKLLDFGLAKLGAPQGVSSRTTSGLVFGTPHYMSPEQLKSSTDVDPAADVWALGIILYQLVYGVVPFDGQNVSQLIASILTATPEMPAARGVPSDVRRIILRCLAKDPAKRFRHARALGAELERTPHGVTNAHDFTGVTPRPWSIDQVTRQIGEQVSSSDSIARPWGRLEWIAATASCFVMLVAGVLMSSAMSNRTSAGEAPPPAVEGLPPPVLPSSSSSYLHRSGVSQPLQSPPPPIQGAQARP